MRAGKIAWQKFLEQVHSHHGSLQACREATKTGLSSLPSGLERQHSPWVACGPYFDVKAQKVPFLPSQE